MNSSTTYSLFITLTIKKQKKGDEFKNHVDKYLKFLIRHIKKTNINTDKLSICWFLEFQKNGNPHIHMYVGGVKSLYVDRYIMSKYWGLNCIGDKDVARVGHNITKMYGSRQQRINYGMKYARKNEQKQVPEDYINVGRFWGVRGNRERTDHIIVINPIRNSNRTKQKEINQAISIIKSVIIEMKTKLNGYIYSDSDNTSLFIPYDCENRETIKKILYQKIKYLLELDNIEYELFEYYEYKRKFLRNDTVSWLE